MGSSSPESRKRETMPDALLNSSWLSSAAHSTWTLAEGTSLTVSLPAANTAGCNGPAAASATCCNVTLSLDAMELNVSGAWITYVSGAWSTPGGESSPVAGGRLSTIPGLWTAVGDLTGRLGLSASIPPTYAAIAAAFAVISSRYAATS